MFKNIFLMGAIFGSVFYATVSMAAHTTYTWTGGVDTVWDTAANWDGNGVPVDEYTGNSPNSDGLNGDMTVVFDGTNMPISNVPGIGAWNGGTTERRTPILQLNSGGELTVDYVGLDSGVVLQDVLSATVLTVGDGSGNAGDVTLNITGDFVMSRHPSSAVYTTIVNSDGVLNVSGFLQLTFGDDRAGIMQVKGGSIDIGSDLRFTANPWANPSNNSGSKIELDVGSSFIVGSDLHNYHLGEYVDFRGRDILFKFTGGNGFASSADVTNKFGALFRTTTENVGLHESWNSGHPEIWGAPIYTWSGAADLDWNNASNWDATNGIPVDQVGGASGLNGDMTIIFAGTNMPTNAPDIGGMNNASIDKHDYDTPRLELRSGGTLAVNYDSLDSGIVINSGSGVNWFNRDVLTIGDGISGVSEDVVLDVTGHLNLNRHERQLHMIVVEEDGTLDVELHFKLTFSNDRDAVVDINGGTVLVGGNLYLTGGSDSYFDLKTGAEITVTGYIDETENGAYFDFTGDNTKLIAAYGGDFDDIAAVNAKIGTIFKSTNGKTLTATDLGGTYKVMGEFVATASIFCFK